MSASGNTTIPTATSTATTSSGAKKCGKLLGIFLLPPVLLALWAALEAQRKDANDNYHNYHTNSNNNNNNNKDDNTGFAGIFFGCLLTYMFQLIAVAVFLYTVLGASRQYAIYQQYLREDGSSLDISGRITKHHITITRTNFVESRQTHELTYMYQYLDEEDDEDHPGTNTVSIYQKTKRIVYRCSLCNPPLLTDLARQRTGGQSLPTIPLKLLVGQPGSGYPTLLVQEELQIFWLRQALKIVVAVAGMVFLVWVLFMTEVGTTAVPNVVASCMWSAVAGLLVARKKLETWEEATLRNGLVRQERVNSTSSSSSSPSSPPPMAVAKLVDEEEDEEQALALTTTAATPTAITKETEMPPIV